MRAIASRVDWLRRHDPGFNALRRAARAAIIMPLMFALGTRVIGNPNLATFAALGSFAMLLMVDFTGTMRDRLQAQAALGVATSALICLGTIASFNPWVAAISMAVVGFTVVFAGVISSEIAAATTPLLLSFILPVTLRGNVRSVPDRVAGWAMASGVSLVAIALLWPAPTRDPLRAPAIAACRALATRLRADVAFRLGGRHQAAKVERDQAGAAANAAVMSLHKRFLATPYRPTGLSTAARGLVRLVDELNWLNAISTASTELIPATVVSPASCRVKAACADVLERSAVLLDRRTSSPTALHAAVGDLQASLAALEHDATIDLPIHGVITNDEQHVDEFISSLDPSFRAQELSFAVSQIAANIDFSVAEERRGWIDRLLGRQPAGLANTFVAAQERAGAHVERHSVWLHNSVRSAVGLGLAVLVANLAGVQHSFWVVLGTLSVLRSNAVNTGQNALRSLAGTVAGFAIGALILVPIGSHTGVLWALLPIAILIAGVAPAAISFTAGQAAFTLVLVILFNIIAPSGWRVGLIRLEDIALGCAVSFFVGAIFWPRGGASAALGRALAEAYDDSARYLDAAVMFGVKKCERSSKASMPPHEESLRAAAAARRLDDTFRTYLIERGTKLVPLGEMSSLVTGVAGIRLAADAVVDLWNRDDGHTGGDRAAARSELIDISRRVHAWYEEFAKDLIEPRELQPPLSHDKRADARLIDAVRRDLRQADGNASAVAVRMIWTGDHLDAARRLQTTLIEPAQAAVRRRAFQPLDSVLRLTHAGSPTSVVAQSNGIGQSSQQT